MNTCVWKQGSFAVFFLQRFGEESVQFVKCSVEPYYQIRWREGRQMRLELFISSFVCNYVLVEDCGAGYGTVNSVGFFYVCLYACICVHILLWFLSVLIYFYVHLFGKGNSAHQCWNMSWVFGNCLQFHTSFGTRWNTGGFSGLKPASECTWE